MPHRDAAATCTLDSELRYLSGNEAFFALLGRSREEILGRRYLDLFPELEGGEGHRMLLAALHTLQPQRVRIRSGYNGRLVDCEVFAVAGGLQAAFRLVPEEEDGA